MKPPTHFRLRIIIACIIFVFCFLPAATYWRAQNRIAHQTTTKFDERTDGYVDELKHALDAYGNVLYSTRGLFAASDVDSDSWNRFISSQPVANRYPGIQAIAYAKVVAPEDLARYEDEQQASHGREHVHVHPLKDQGDYAVITFHSQLSNIPSTQQSLGLDIASDSVRRAALELAQQINDIAATGPITLAALKTPGFLLVMPIAGGDKAQPSAKPKGYSIAIFDIERLITAHLGDALKKSKTSLRIEDVTAEPQLFYNQPYPTRQRTINRDVTISVGTRKWRLVFSAPSASMTTVTDRMAPNVMMFVSILIIVLAGFTVYTYRLRRSLRKKS